MDEIKQRYKQTDIGLIPEEWAVKPMGKILKIRHGRDQKSVVSIDGKYPILGTGGLMGYANSFLYNQDSVLIGRKGTINKPMYMNKPFWTVDTLFYSEIKKDYLPKFIFFKFQMIDWYAYNEASGVPSLNAKTIERIDISVPNNIIEQTAIATALTDTDTLIAALDKKISKNQQIKQGAMQQLLTGKKRLPGFCKVNKYKETEIGLVPEDWEIKNLGELGEPIIGLTYKPENVSAEGKLVLRSSNIKDTKLVFDDKVFVNIEIPEKIITRKGDILVCVRNGSRELIGKSAIINDHAIGQTFGAFMSVFRSNFNDFLIHVFHSNIIKNQIDMHLGATINQITNASLSSFIVAMPKEKSEQTAIAQILTDMDNEVARLEKERDKYVQLKAGMMQVLLTGKIRLVKSNIEKDSVQIITKEVTTKSHNQPFEDAALIAAIVNSFYSEKYFLGRKKVQKLLYLLRRKQEVSVVAFKRKAAGPYAHEIRYKGGESIAKNNGYVTENSNKKGSIFGKGENINEALGYISKWEMQQDIDWLVSQFKYTPVDQLEVLATVDMAICDLGKGEKSVSLKSIKDLISSDKEWKDKLNKPYFNDISILDAITQSRELFS